MKVETRFNRGDKAYYLIDCEIESFVCNSFEIVGIENGEVSIMWNKRNYGTLIDEKELYNSKDEAIKAIIKNLKKDKK